MNESPRDGSPSVSASQVRRAVATDIPSLAALEAACFRESWDAEFLGLWFDPQSGALWVISQPQAGREAQPSGYALFQLLPGQTELLRVAVAPEARGHGLARRLLEVALAELAAAGRTTCFLEVRASNRSAISLYEGLSFARVGVRRGYYADGEDALLFRRSGPTRAG